MKQFPLLVLLTDTLLKTSCAMEQRIAWLNATTRMPLKSAMDNMLLVSGVHKVSLHVSICIETYLPTMFPVVPRCNNGDFRSGNVTYTYEDTDVSIYSGQIEVCVNGSYIALCDSGFTERTAELACRASGYGPPFFREFLSLSMDKRDVNFELQLGLLPYY